MSQSPARGGWGACWAQPSPILRFRGCLTHPASPLPHAQQQRRAPPIPRARAAGRRALGRVRGVRWRWGRREPELSQARGPPDGAKWGVMAAGGSCCTSTAGGGDGGGRGVNPRRSGRCVCICVRCVRGGEEGGWDRVRPRRLVALVPSRGVCRSRRLAEPRPSPRFPDLGPPGVAFSSRAGGSVDGGIPGGAGRPRCASHTMCFVCFSLPRSRFPLCGGRRDHKGLTHIFNPPPKSKWPVWCLRSARRPLAPVRPCV